MPQHRRGRASLAQGLDREVHQIVRKITDERLQYGEAPRITATLVYDEIRRSNTSLNRKPRKLLEDSIERALEVIRQDGEESDSEADLDRPDSPRPTKPASNGMNKSIVAMWNSASTNGTTTPTTNMVEEATSKLSQEPPRKKRKRGPDINTSPPTHISLRDLGGVGPVAKQFSRMLNIPLLCPAMSSAQSVRGILIHGPPGCGKTTIANAIAAAYGVNFIQVSAPSIVSGMSGESEKALRDCFEQAKQAAPCLLFLDEIDAITPKRESASREMEKRIVAQLATLMDGLDPELNDGKAVIVLAATNRPEALDPALRRGGRFDKEINMTVPNETMRQQILQTLTRNLSLADDVNLHVVAVRTPGYVGADLRDLVSTANNTAIQRFQDELALNANAESIVLADPGAEQAFGTTETMQLDQDKPANYEDTELEDVFNMITYLRNHPPSPEPILITQADFIDSLAHVFPSALREGFATVPNTTFDSIGGLSPTITTLTTKIIDPILKPHIYASLKITPSSGALLFGPPGCGKTLLARAIANASHANFIAVKGPELLNKYVGESERAVRSVFQRARSSVPCIIFFDELDALVPDRGGPASEASSRVVNTLLTELDGVGGDRAGIYIVAATNRPDMIDAAVRRPGRLDSMIYVGMPDVTGRKEILQALTRDVPGFVWDARMDELVGLAPPPASDSAPAARCPTEGFSGADLANLRNQAGYEAVDRLRLSGDTALAVLVEDFVAASRKVTRSVSEDDLKRYEKLKKKWEHVAGS